MCQGLSLKQAQLETHGWVMGEWRDREPTLTFSPPTLPEVRVSWNAGATVGLTVL